MSVTAADTLVERFPDAASQLLGPVYSYLRPYAPFPTEQSLYLSVFYPAARGWAPGQEFPAHVLKVNPGIVTVADYVTKARKAGARQWVPGAVQVQAGRVAAALGVPMEWLHNLISLESGWNPAARNRFTGARGLIQFMPKTAAALRVVPLAGTMGGLVLVAVLAWVILKG